MRKENPKLPTDFLFADHESVAGTSKLFVPALFQCVLVGLPGLSECCLLTPLMLGVLFPCRSIMLEHGISKNITSIDSRFIFLLDPDISASMVPAIPWGISVDFSPDVSSEISFLGVFR